MNPELRYQPCMLRNLPSPHQACSWVRESFSPKVIAAIGIWIIDTRDTEASLASGIAKTQKHLSQDIYFRYYCISRLGCHQRDRSPSASRPWGPRLQIPAEHTSQLPWQWWSLCSLSLFASSWQSCKIVIGHRPSIPSIISKAYSASSSYLFSWRGL